MGIKSFYTSSRLALGSRPLPMQKPTVLQFPINDICNSRCQMCNIWENKQSTDINLEQLRTGLDNSLYSEVTAVGVNGGEPTLRADLPDIVDVLFEMLPKLKTISLITNGYKYKQVIERIQEVGEIVQKYNGHFDLMLSLDGYAEVHDLVRGHKNYFEKSINVIDYAENSNLVNNFRIGCTVIKVNVNHLADLFDYCIKRNVYIKYRLGIPHQRLYTKNLIAPYALSNTETYELVEFLEGLCLNYEKNESQLFFYRSLIEQLLYGKARQAGCDWQHRGATISSKGELLYCAVKSDAILDDISQGDSEKAYFGNRDHQLKIIDENCDDCNHDYVGIPPREEYIRRLVKRIDNKFKVKSRLNSRVLHLALDLRKEYKFKSRLKTYFEYRNSKINININNEDTNILICGWYGTETLGDKAILGGLVDSIYDTYGKDVKIYLASLNPYVSEITKIQMPELEAISIITVEQSIASASQMHLVMFGGGPIMAITNIAEMEALFKAAKLGAAKTLIAGCGVGPLGDDYQNECIERILNLSDYRIYRDEKSKTIAHKLGVDVSDDKVAEDPAFTWLDIKFSEINTSKKIVSSKKVLLLGLRDFPYLEYAKHIPVSQAKEIKSVYERTVIKVLKKLSQEYPELIIKPLPMCTNHFGSDDRWFYRRLFRNETVLINKLDYSLLGAEQAPIEYAKAFASSDALLAMRFHSLVFGLSLGVPSVALDYTLGRGKVGALAEKHSVPVLRLDLIDEDLLFDYLIQALSRVIHSTGEKPCFKEAFKSFVNKQ